MALHKTHGTIKGKVNLFYNQINDYVFQQSTDSNGDGLADRVNDESNLDLNGTYVVQNFAQIGTKFYGLEAEANIELLPKTLNLQLFTNMVYAKLNQNGNVPRLTPQRFGLELDHQYGAWQSNFNVTRVARQNRVARLESETQGYTLMNTEVAYHVKGGRSTKYTFFVQDKNLLDSDIRVHTSFLKNTAPLTGHTAVVGIMGTF